MLTATKQYRSVAVLPDTHWKLETWRRELSDRWDRRVTMNETVDWLIDSVGVPENRLKVEHIHTYKVLDDKPVCVYCGEELEL